MSIHFCRTTPAMTMASSSSLEDAVSELMGSPGGQLLNSARDYLPAQLHWLDCSLPDWL